MKDILLQLQAGKALSFDQSRDVFMQIMGGSVDPVVISAILLGLSCRPTDAEELAGAASAMREHSVKVDTNGIDVVLDTCGTGGDIKGTFNISTAAAMIIASCGVKVVKHGNRSASSKSGSADVLEALGVKLDPSHDVLCACLQDANICFAFARAHHPAMKHVAPIRQALGVPTIFNLLGPLTNPGNARHQVLGVYKPELAKLMANTLQRLGSAHAWVVHGHDGLDELSTMSKSTIIEVKDGNLVERVVDPQSLGLEAATLDQLRVESAQASAQVIRDISEGEQSPAADIACLNAAAGLVVAGRVAKLEDGLALARAACREGAVAKTLQTLIGASNR